MWEQAVNRSFLPPLLGFLCASAFIGSASAATLEVGADQTFKQPSEAVAKANEGDTIRIAPGEYFDCAVLRQNNLVFEGVGFADKVVLTDKTCQGKAILVTSGQNITVRNMTLTRARVPDSNGAGIRAEGANLKVEGVRFINKDGILAATEPRSTIVIRDSEFLKNGVCNPGCAHGIYVNNIDRLVVEHSHFADTHQGHHIKSRANRTEIIGNTIEDGPDGTASYLVDIPNGGDLVLRGNTMEKGPKAENHSAAVVIGEEGVSNRTNEITVQNNNFRLDGDYQTIFVRNLTATEAQLTGNKLSGGKIKALEGDGEVH
jgi:Right handed beta helix region